MFAGEDGTPSFCYTAGLTDRGWPELIMYGVPGEYANGIINSLTEQCAARGRPPAVGEVFHEVANLPLKLGSFCVEAHTSDVTQTLQRQLRVGGGMPEFLHCVVPDREGRFPLDAGYDTELMGWQTPKTENGEWDYEVNASGN